LDVFSRRKETLYIGSSYEREKDFAELYARELRQSPNIVPLGWVDLSGPRYRDVLKRCRFCILPSCAEAYPGSILNPMTEGLIPVMTLESGFDDADRYGILIREGTVEGVSAAVDRAVSMSEEEIAVKRDRLLEAARAFQPEAFRAGFERFMDEVEGT
jgi:glycosyltransferase involved in cell wall biosynthesis